MTWKKKERLWYRAGHLLSTGLTNIFLRPKIIGKENIPKHGAVLIAPNHRSMLDVPCLGCATFRPMRFMAKKDLFKNKFVKWYFETNGSFSVNNQDNDPVAVKKAIAILKDGDALVIFPEGKRNKTDQVGELAPGIGFIAIKGSAPILPVGIAGLDKVIIRKLFGFIPIFTRAKIVIGLPIISHLSSESKTSEVAKELLPKLQAELNDLYRKAKKL